MKLSLRVQPAPMMTGPRTVQRCRRLPTPIYGALQRAVYGLAAHVALDAAQDEAVGLQHVLELAGVLPPTRDGVRFHAQATVDHVLDGIGDLELTARRRLDGLDALEDGRRNRYTPTSARSLRGSVGFSTSRAVSVAVELGDAVGVRIGDLLQQDECVRTVSSKARTNGVMPSLRRLSPRYMTNGSSPRNSSAMSTACANPSGASCGM